jgi:hypothetical protein
MQKSANGLLQYPIGSRANSHRVGHPDQRLSGHEPGTARFPVLHRRLCSFGCRGARCRVVDLELEMVLAHARRMRCLYRAHSGIGQPVDMTWLSAVSLFCSSSKKIATEVIGLLTLAIRKRWVGVTFSPVCLSAIPKPCAYTRRPSRLIATARPRTSYSFMNACAAPAITTRSRLRISSLADREAAHVVGKTLAIPVAKLRFKSQRWVIWLIVSCSIAE